MVPVCVAVTFLMIVNGVVYLLGIGRVVTLAAAESRDQSHPLAVKGFVE